MSTAPSAKFSYASYVTRLIHFSFLNIVAVSSESAHTAAGTVPKYSNHRTQAQGRPEDHLYPVFI